MKALIMLLIAVPAGAAADALFFESLGAGRAAFLEVKHAQLAAPPPASFTVKAKVLVKLAGALPDAYVDDVFADPRLKLDMRIPPMFGQKGSEPPYSQYRRIFMSPERVAAGVQFAAANDVLLSAISARYGVDMTLLVAEVGIETYFGRYTGGFEVVNALFTIADQVPSRQLFAVRELAEYLKFCSAERLDVFQIKGSYAGAFGLGQFIPSSFNVYAVDWDGDGRKRWDEWPDMLATVANYLQRNGARGADFSPGSPNYGAVFAYNHSENYVKVVLELRQAIIDRQAGR